VTVDLAHPERFHVGEHIGQVVNYRAAPWLVTEFEGWFNYHRDPWFNLAPLSGDKRYSTSAAPDDWEVIPQTGIRGYYGVHDAAYDRDHGELFTSVRQAIDRIWEREHSCRGASDVTDAFEGEGGRVIKGLTSYMHFAPTEMDLYPIFDGLLGSEVSHSLSIGPRRGVVVKCN